MDLQEFILSTAENAPPRGCAPMLAALWHLRKGEWQRAHEIVQAHEGEKPSAWVHAHLHRVEGDLSNAGYWYRRAGRKAAETGLEDEWQALAAHFLEGQDKP
jgi:hypothetical protein